MTPKEKLKEIIEKSELSYPKFAKKIGVKPYTIKNIIANNQEISDELALKLEAEYGIPFKWWKTGEGDLTAISTNNKDCINLPLITASAGGGYSLIEDKRISVPTAELIEAGFNKFEHLVIVKISGKSMQPTINDGDVLVIDTQIEGLYDDGIYVLNYKGELFCKRILKGLTYLKLKSDNPEYDIEKIEGQEREKLNIIGKVAYRMNKF